MVLSGRSSTSITTPHHLSNIVKPLLDWYQQFARQLPWRQNLDPYRILVSEVMLQQTRVETVKPYFERFMATLPTLNDLAQADEMLLLKLWEGLGYYRRVRNLQKTAQIIVKEYQGVVPADYEALLKLPGIGEYTAGSVASIAYNIAVPAVDGNVLRVIARLLNSPENISMHTTRKYFRQLVFDILPLDAPGTFNQAMMELGATVCLSRNLARCSECPIASLCLAQKEHTVERLPYKEAKKQRTIENRTLFIFLAPNHTLLRQRPEEGLLSKLWEFPNLEGFLQPLQVRQQLVNWGIAPETNLLQLPPAKHIFTHLEWHFHAYLLHTYQFPPPPDFQWVSLEEISQHYALPSAFQVYTSRLAHWNKQL